MDDRTIHCIADGCTHKEDLISSLDNMFRAYRPSRSLHLFTGDDMGPEIGVTQQELQFQILRP